MLLTVRGRRSGEARTVPVAMLELDGAWFVQACFGEAGWVANLRVAREATITRPGGRRVPVLSSRHSRMVRSESPSVMLRTSSAATRAASSLRPILKTPDRYRSGPYRGLHWGDDSHPRNTTVTVVSLDGKRCLAELGIRTCPARRSFAVTRCVRPEPVLSVASGMECSSLFGVVSTHCRLNTRKPRSQ